VVSTPTWGREPKSGHPLLAAIRREHGAQQAGAEVGEAVSAEERDEDGVDVAGVVEPGRRPDMGPRVGPVPPQLPFDRPALCRPVRRPAGKERVAGLAGSRLRRIAAAASPFAAAEQLVAEQWNTTSRDRAHQAGDTTAQAAAADRHGTHTV
jgi:hypothetical protein